MKILVTGAAGFIGSHLCEKLISLKHEVIGIDNFSDYYSLELKKSNAEEISKIGVKLIEKDLSEDDIKGISENVDFVFHLAAQPGISSLVPFEKYLKNNLIATKRLSDEFINSSDLKLFVNIATSSVYGKHATDTEEMACKPASYYGVTKLASEQLILSYFRDKDFPACSVRPFSIYGERERPEKLYPKLINSILNDEEFSLYEGSKNHIRSYTYVGDLVEGLISIIENKDKCLGEIFNMGIDSTITTGEGIEIIEKIIGKKAKIKTIPKRAGDQLETYANIEKAKRILGYNPKVKPEEGLAREVTWFTDKVFKPGINLYN